MSDYPGVETNIRRAPDRGFNLTKDQTAVAIKNALRYIPEEIHEVLAKEFLDELLSRGRVYGCRFRPKGRLYGKPVDEYKGRCVEGKALQVMIDNNRPTLKT
jgi:urocanate hydratase